MRLKKRLVPNDEQVFENLPKKSEILNTGERKNERFISQDNVKGLILDFERKAIPPPPADLMAPIAQLTNMILNSHHTNNDKSRDC